VLKDMGWPGTFFKALNEATPFTVAAAVLN
jgi:hypothetical protein